jgi:hypothetical protein
MQRFQRDSVAHASLACLEYDPSRTGIFKQFGLIRVGSKGHPPLSRPDNRSIFLGPRQYGFTRGNRLLLAAFNRDASYRHRSEKRRRASCHHSPRTGCTGTNGGPVYFFELHERQHGTTLLAVW